MSSRTMLIWHDRFRLIIEAEDNDSIAKGYSINARIRRIKALQPEYRSIIGVPREKLYLVWRAELSAWRVGLLEPGDPLRVRCPSCNSPAGKVCRDIPSGRDGIPVIHARKVNPHDSRIEKVGKR